MWVLDYLEDIDSDMSVFHRVDDARTMLPGPLYFERAERLTAYAGVMQARALESRRRAGNTGPSTKVSDTAMLERLAGEGWVERG